MPCTGRISPSSDNSPTTMARLRFSGGNNPIVPNKARAIGKSKPEPILRKGAGARFTTTLRTGKLNPELLTADKIRSRLSLIVLSGRPTILKTLIPTVTSTSTSIKWASIPKTVAENVLAIIVTIEHELCLNLIFKGNQN